MKYLKRLYKRSLSILPIFLKDPPKMMHRSTSIVVDSLFDEDVNFDNVPVTWKDVAEIDKAIFKEVSKRRTKKKSLTFDGIAFSSDIICLYRCERGEARAIEIADEDSFYANLHKVNGYGENRFTSRGYDRIHAQYRTDKEVGVR